VNRVLEWQGFSKVSFFHANHSQPTSEPRLDDGSVPHEYGRTPDVAGAQSPTFPFIMVWFSNAF
jgi:hypothetical protein